MRITGYCSSRSLLQVLDGIEQLVLAAVNGQGHGQVLLITGFLMSQADLQVLAGDLKDGIWTIAKAGSRLSGDDLANILIGNSGNDSLNGGDANDQLRGGLGLDRLTGGNGSGTFRFDTTPSIANRNLIVDFSSAEGDVLSFSKVVYTGFGAGVTAALEVALLSGSPIPLLRYTDFLLS